MPLTPSCRVGRVGRGGLERGRWRGLMVSAFAGICGGATGTCGCGLGTPSWVFTPVGLSLDGHCGLFLQQ